MNTNITRTVFGALVLCSVLTFVIMVVTLAIRPQGGRCRIGTPSNGTPMWESSDLTKSWTNSVEAAGYYKHHEAEGGDH